MPVQAEDAFRVLSASATHKKLCSFFLPACRDWAFLPRYRLLPPRSSRCETSFRSRNEDSMTIPSHPMSVRHTMCCIPMSASDGCLSRGAGSVNCVVCSAKSAAEPGSLSFQRGAFARECFRPRHGFLHGVAKNGYRKRSHDYVACGVTIRLRGEGILEFHGHFGRLVGWWLSSSVVEPDREAWLRRGRLFRGSHERTATLISCHGFVRLSALDADSTAWATRPGRCAVSRATLAPATTVGVSGGWARRTPFGPSMRRRAA